jgi:hypothetical protein
MGHQSSTCTAPPRRVEAREDGGGCRGEHVSSGEERGLAGVLLRSIVICNCKTSRRTAPFFPDVLGTTGRWALSAVSAAGYGCDGRGHGGEHGAGLREFIEQRFARQLRVLACESCRSFLPCPSRSAARCVAPLQSRWTDSTINSAGFLSGSLTEKKLTGRVGEKMTPTPRRLLECFRGREAKSVQSAQVV